MTQELPVTVIPGLSSRLGPKGNGEDFISKDTGAFTEAQESLLS